MQAIATVAGYARYCYCKLFQASARFCKILYCRLFQVIATMQAKASYCILLQSVSSYCMLTKALHCKLLQLPSQCEPLYAISRYCKMSRLLQSIVAIESYCALLQVIVLRPVAYCCKTMPLSQAIAYYCKLLQAIACYFNMVQSKLLQAIALPAASSFNIGSYCKLLQAIASFGIASPCGYCMSLPTIARYCMLLHVTARLRCKLLPM